MAARNAPLMDPIPPMTTTTKQMIRMLFSMPGSTDEKGAAMAQARAANAPPMANTKRYRRLMCKPTDKNRTQACGEEGVSTGRYRWERYIKKNKKILI